MKVFITYGIGQCFMQYIKLKVQEVCYMYRKKVPKFTFCIGFYIFWGWPKLKFLLINYYTKGLFSVQHVIIFTKIYEKYKNLI